MSVESEVTEKIFIPGNLVWGVGQIGVLSEEDWRSILTNGIRTPRGAGKVRRLSFTNDWISTAIMPKLPLPNRYRDAGHRGPTSENPNPLEAGIVLSIEAILKLFPDQVKAIGDMFWCTEYREDALKLYDFSPDFKAVYGIPIKYPAGEPSWGGEVRIYPDDPLSAALFPAIWTGVVVREIHLPIIQKWSEGIDLPKTIPVLSTECKLIANNIVKTS